MCQSSSRFGPSMKPSRDTDIIKTIFLIAVPPEASSWVRPLPEHLVRPGTDHQRGAARVIVASPRVHAKARLVHTWAVDERKVATVLFADLVGSTELGGSQDPERTRAMLERFYEAMAAEIEAAGGTVEKFAGDAVMAAFGAPAAYEDHAERALHAALSMRRQLETLFGGRLVLRVGVNTGDVMVGRPREGSSFVTGDAVNVAARLEQAAAPGEILVGER